MAQACLSTLPCQNPCLTNCLHHLGVMDTIYVPPITYAEVHYPSTGIDADHRSHHLNGYHVGNYRGKEEGQFFNHRLITMSTTAEGPEGNYLYLVVSDADLRCMEDTMHGDTLITTLLSARQHYVPLNMHFCMRDAIIHYMALVERDYETDLHPHVLCLKVDYKALLREDTSRVPGNIRCGVFNRHYMEHSMFSYHDITKVLHPTVDYDHYMMDLPTFEDYRAAMPEPVYLDYTSAVTKSHILSNPRLVPEILTSPEWTRLVDDWDEHFKPSLGEIPRHDHY